MNYCHKYEQEKFIKDQKEKAEQYRAQGMSEEQIETIHEYDCSVFKEERCYRENCIVSLDYLFEHASEFDAHITMTVPDKAVSRKFKYSKSEFQNDLKNNYSLEFRDAVLNLSEKERYILEEVLQGRELSEIGKNLGVCRQNISRHYQKIRKKFEKFLQ
jgi:DNA-binding NarL/FixJ family response regulator